MNRLARRRVSSQPHPRWTLRFVVGLLAVTVALAYGGGISLAHWTTAVDAVTGIGTGSLTVGVADDGSEVEFECDTRAFPHHALSFVRLWAPDQTPGDLVSHGSGAVKIEEDGNETGDGYWIDPADAAIGDPAVITLGTSAVTIQEWVPKPGEVDEYIGFTYSVEGDPVTVDARASTDLWRQIISGSGVWSLDEIAYDGGTTVISSCEPASSDVALTITNAGSVPALPYLTLSGDPISTECAAVEATITNADGAVLDSGLLCSLYGQPLLVIEQIDPGDETAVTILLHPVLPAAPGVHAEAFVAEVRFTQWNAPLDTGFGWIDTVGVPISVTLTAEEPPDGLVGSAPVSAPPLRAPNTTLSPPEGVSPDATTPEPGSAPAAAAFVPPGVEPTAPDSTDPAPAHASLTGIVWLDADGNTAKVPGDDEAGIPGVWVALLDESGVQQSLTLTDANGFYSFEGIEPGRYVVGVRAPDGSVFPGVTTDASDDSLLVEGLAETLAAQWEVDPRDVVASDVVRATATPLGIVGWTAVLDLTGSADTLSADAALITAPVDPPTEPQETEAPESKEPSVASADNTDISAKEPEPNPFDEQLPADGSGGGIPEGTPPTEP